MNRTYGTDGNVYETSISNGKEYTSLKKDKEDFAIEELEKVKAEIQSIIALADSRGEDTKLAYQCQTAITERISELKENDTQKSEPDDVSKYDEELKSCMESLINLFQN